MSDLWLATIVAVLLVGLFFVVPGYQMLRAWRKSRQKVTPDWTEDKEFLVAMLAEHSRACRRQLKRQHIAADDPRHVLEKCKCGYPAQTLERVREMGRLGDMLLQAKRDIRWAVGKKRAELREQIKFLEQVYNNGLKAGVSAKPTPYRKPRTVAAPKSPKPPKSRKVAPTDNSQKLTLDDTLQKAPEMDKTPEVVDTATGEAKDVTGSDPN